MSIFSSLESAFLKPKTPLIPSIKKRKKFSILESFIEEAQLEAQ